MKNKIEILCPSRNCPRCKKSIKFIEKLSSEKGWDVKIIIITKLSEFLKFRTWLLPSIFVNGKKVSRGYIPKPEDIEQHLK